MTSLEGQTGTGLPALEQFLVARSNSEGNAGSRAEQSVSAAELQRPAMERPASPIIQREDMPRGGASKASSVSTQAPSAPAESSTPSSEEIATIADEVYSRVARELRRDLYDQRERKGAMVHGW